MAKVTAPLMSLDARGQFAKTMVFIGWKGIRTVRQFVIPANPNTAAQQAQRTLMAAAVATWKILGAVAKDAWNSWAPYESKPMSGFNSQTKAAIAFQKASPDAALSNEISLTPGDTILTATCILTKISNQAPVPSATGFELLYGTDARNLSFSESLVWNAGTTVYDFDLSGLVNDTQYYGRIQRTSGPMQTSGLLTFTPSV